MRPETTQSRSEAWVALALCAAVFAAGVLEQLVHDQPAYAEALTSDWLPLAAAGLGAAAIVVRLAARRPRWLRLQGALGWGGLLLMLWAAGGLMIDLLRVASLLVPDSCRPASTGWGWRRGRLPAPPPSSSCI